MSRAFVKEPDGSELPDERPRPLASPHPNYITRAGLDALRARRDALAAACPAAAEPKALDQHVSYLDDRIAKAIVVDAPGAGTEEVRFGARVRVAGESGEERLFTIVGEDEADPAADRISWVAPLAQAVLGARSGDVVTWERPLGALEIEVLAVEYDAPEHGPNGGPPRGRPGG